MSFKALFLIAGFGFAGPAAAQIAPCNVGTISATSDTNSLTPMTASSGQICSAPVAPAGAKVQSAKIEIPAKYGTASADGANFEYKSMMGFTGPDKFVVSITSAQDTTNLTVNVIP